MGGERTHLDFCYLVMCPECLSKDLREQQKLVHPFERLPKDGRLARGRGKQRHTADRSKMVKEYTRPAAGKHEPTPCELRPMHVLLKTTDYLITRITQLTSHPWWMVYEFVFDRMRAIRQDMVIQELVSPQATQVLEKIARFHIYAGFRLCDDDRSHFDAHINNTHIQECLKRLLVAYEALPECRHNMAEFVSLYLLHNLGSHEAIAFALQHKAMLCGCPDFDLALKISLHAVLGNFFRVLRCAFQLKPLQLCAFHKHLYHWQRQALLVMSSGYNSKNLPYSVGDLTRLLNTEDDVETVALCEAHGLGVGEKGVHFVKGNYKDLQEQGSSRRKSRCLERYLQDVNVPNLLIFGDQLSSNAPET